MARKMLGVTSVIYIPCRGWEEARGNWVKLCEPCETHTIFCRKGAVACLYQEGGMTAIMFHHQTGQLMCMRAYNQDFMVPNFEHS